MTVRELLARVDSREITEWIAYYRVQAEDEQRARDSARPPDPKAQRPP